MSADDQAIAKLAYQLWESRGRPPGSGEQDWLEAEAMLAASERTDEKKAVGVERRAAPKRPANKRATTKPVSASEPAQSVTLGSGHQAEAATPRAAGTPPTVAADLAEQSITERRKSGVKKATTKRDSPRSSPR